MKNLLILGAAAIAAASPAAAQPGAGMTVEEIAAAATGAPMNGGMIALQKAPSTNGVPYYLAVIPNTDIQFGVGGVNCSAPSSKCKGVGFIFPAGPAGGLAQEAIDKLNLDAPYNKFYRVQGVLVLTIEQSLIGGGAATVRESVVNLERGIGKLVETIDAAQSVQIDYGDDQAQKTGVGEGPPLTLVFSGGQKQALQMKSADAAMGEVFGSWSRSE